MEIVLTVVLMGLICAVQLLLALWLVIGPARDNAGNLAQLVQNQSQVLGTVTQQLIQSGFSLQSELLKSLEHDDPPADPGHAAPEL